MHPAKKQTRLYVTKKLSLLVLNELQLGNAPWVPFSSYTRRSVGHVGLKHLFLSCEPGGRSRSPWEGRPFPEKRYQPGNKVHLSCYNSAWHPDQEPNNRARQRAEEPDPALKPSSLQRLPLPQGQPMPDRRTGSRGDRVQGGR